MSKWAHDWDKDGFDGMSMQCMKVVKRHGEGVERRCLNEATSGGLCGIHQRWAREVEETIKKAGKVVEEKP